MVNLKRLRKTRVIIKRYGFRGKIYRLKFAFAVFARKFVQRDASIAQHLPDAKSSLLAALPGITSARKVIGISGRAQTLVDLFSRSVF
jgi:hypothetical protein